MAHRTRLTFLLNDREIALDAVGASDTLLDFLRIDRRLTGTKEGCAEGDCGACTVLVGQLGPTGLVYESVNACIRFLASVDRCHVVTIEHLRGAEGGLHPVQQAMVDFHGAQCGFCTPGIVMSLYALWMTTPKPSTAEVETALQGNLCRCTGYAPIIRAAQNWGGGQSTDPLAAERDRVTATLNAMEPGRADLTRNGERVILPASADDLAEVLAAEPRATVIAGATDVGLWVTKHLRPISPAVFIGHLNDLKGIEEMDGALRIGAGVTYTEAAEAILSRWPHLAAYWNRIGGWQVRNAGTIGGNIANGSPIGDTPPVLIALDAQVVLRKGTTRRCLPLESFFIAYGKQDRAPGEFVERIDIPLPSPGQVHAAYKISKRRDEDISTVAMGIRLALDAGRITEARIVLGGMAGVPKRASRVEAALIGQPLTEAALVAAAARLGEDVQPLSDWRGSAEYRMIVARNLLRRFALEQTGALEEVGA